MPWNLGPSDTGTLVDIVKGIAGFGTPGDREALIRTALGISAANRIMGSLNLDGAPDVVAARVINHLVTFGRLESGEESLKLFLKLVATRVGMDVDKDIEKIIYKCLTVTICPPDLVGYRNCLRDRAGFIDIRGIGRCGPHARRWPLSELFIMLHVVDPSEGRISLRDSVQKHRLSGVLGDAGTGKTTFLKALVLDLVDAQDGPLPLWDDATQLHRFVDSRRAEGHAGPACDLLLEHWIAKWSHFGFTTPWLRGQLKEGRFWILLDGLNELPNEDARIRLAALIDEAVREWPTCHWVVTSRPGVWHGRSQPLDFRVFVIDVLDDKGIRAFVRAWSTLAYGDSGVTPAVPRTDGVISPRSVFEAELIRAIRDRGDLRLLARNPLMLTAMAVIHWNGRQMPEGRAEVLEAIIDWLIKVRHRPFTSLHPNMVWECYMELALQTFLHPDGPQREFGRRWAGTVITAYFGASVGTPHAKAIEFMQDEEENTGILAGCPDGMRSTFRYHSYQEYLVARKIASLPDSKAWDVIKDHIDLPEWRNIVQLAFCRLLQWGWPKVDEFVRNLLLPCKTMDLEGKARTIGLLGVILADLVVYDYLVGRIHEYQAVRDEVMAVFDQRGTDVPLQDRFDAAVALGRGGDVRLMQRGSDLIAIPAGSTWVGAQADQPGGKNYDPLAQPNESPVHLVYTGRFEVGQFPVTVQEFVRFIDDGGYSERGRRFWDDPGWDRRESKDITSPERWDLQVSFPNCPVVGVNWYEARAYCRWLSWSEDGDYVYRLPTEGEWEYIARRGHESYQPYCCHAERPETLGDKIHSADSTISPRRPAPVGLFPLDASADGVSDLNGNVHEWIEEPGDPYPATPTSASVARATGGFPAVRGGSFETLPMSCRTAARMSYRGFNRLWDLGFRVVRRRKPVQIKGRTPRPVYRFTLADVFAGRMLETYSRARIDNELRPYGQFCQGIDAARLEALAPKAIDDRRPSFPRLPCVMGAVDGKLDFNLLYQDSRLKLAVEDKLGDAPADQCEREAGALMEVFSILLLCEDGHGVPLWRRLTDNDLDGLVYAVLDDYDPRRQENLLNVGLLTNEKALRGLPPAPDLNAMPLDKLIGYQVAAGTVWWEHCESTFEDQFSGRGSLEIDDVDLFCADVLSGHCHMMFIFDDNGELVWDLALICRLLAESPKLTVTGVVSSRVVPSNANDQTLLRCLEDQRLSILGTELEARGTRQRGKRAARFRLIREDNFRSSIDLAYCSHDLFEELCSVDVLLAKGATSFEVIQSVPVTTYYAFVVHSSDSQICTGLKKGSGVFVRGPRNTIAYGYHDPERTLQKVYHRDLRPGRRPA